jgi:hypothetical protein
VGRSRSGRLSGIDRVVVGQAGVPSLEQRAERAVEGAGSGLLQQVGAAPGPLHLLALGETLSDRGVGRALGHGGRDALARAEPLAPFWPLLTGGSVPPNVTVPV